MLQAAQPAGHIQTLLLQTCAVLGCFVPPMDYVPVLLTALGEPDLPIESSLSQLRVLRALLQGSGGAADTSTGALPCQPVVQLPMEPLAWHRPHCRGRPG